TCAEGDGMAAVWRAPAAGAESEDSSAPGSWTVAAEAAGGSTSVVRGGLTLDGRRAGTAAAFGPDRSLVFRATFAGPGTQWVGLAAGTPTDPWAGFSLQGGT